jgi:peptide/nickel transport system substrate-binding protein
MMFTESTKVVDEYTFQFTTTEPMGAFLTLDAIWLWPVPPHIWGEMDEDGLWEFPEEIPPVTTGPYTLTEWEKGSHMAFAANEDYYGGKPPIDLIYVQFYANETALLNALIAGEIDVIPSDITPQSYESLESEPNITMVESPPGAMLSLEINVSDIGVVHPALKDKMVRHAIDYAIDKQQVIDVVLLGKGILCPNGGLNCGPNHEWFLDPSQKPTPYDPELAVKILDDNGYLDTDGDGIRETPAGQELVFRLYYQVESQIALGASGMVGDMLREIGIGIETTALEFATLQDAAYTQRDYDLAMYVWVGELDPAGADYLYSCWSSEPGSGLNFPGYCNPEYDALVQEHFFTIGLENRLPVAYEAQRVLAEDRPEIVIAGLNQIGAYRNDRFVLPTDPCDNLGFLLGWYPIMNATQVK